MHGTPLRRAEPSPAILAWLSDHGVPYSVHRHEHAATAAAAARADGVSIRAFVKVLAVETDAGVVGLLALDAADRVDLALAARALGARHVRLLAEDEVGRLTPLDEAGALAPIGQLYGLPVFADPALRWSPFLAFEAGSHEAAVHVDRVEWERAANVVYRPLAVSGRSPDARLAR